MLQHVDVGTIHTASELVDCMAAHQASVADTRPCRIRSAFREPHATKTLRTQLGHCAVESDRQRLQRQIR
eukprot:558715-Alexandrium_andersonii.AAC.1